MEDNSDLKKESTRPITPTKLKNLGKEKIKVLREICGQSS